MCRKPLARPEGQLAVNQGIANAIRQRAATRRLLEAVNHSGFRPLLANWAAKAATAAVASSNSADTTARALARITADALFHAGIAKAFSLGMPYDLVGASELFAIAAARGHAAAASHLAYLQVWRDTIAWIRVFLCVYHVPSTLPVAVTRLCAGPQRCCSIPISLCRPQQWQR